MYQTTNSPVAIGCCTGDAHRCVSLDTNNYQHRNIPQAYYSFTIRKQGYWVKEKSKKICKERVYCVQSGKSIDNGGIRTHEYEYIRILL